MTDKTTKTNGVEIGSIQGVFYSINRGQGKTVTLVSYYRHGLERTRKLIIDQERRSRQYKSPVAGKDSPEKLLWDFDYFYDRYENTIKEGEISPETITTFYAELCNESFPYDAILIDNAAMFQDDIRLTLSGPNAMTNLNKYRATFPRVQMNHKRFKPENPVDVYGVVKTIIFEILRTCRLKNIDVLTSTEARNKWKDYGTRDMKILGQMAKILEPFVQFGDFVLVMSRTVGDRELGTAKLIAVPYVTLDSFEPKSSLPGLPPKFEMTWPKFWEYALSRTIATDEALEQVVIQAPETPDYSDDTDTAKDEADKAVVTEAKKRLLNLAIEHCIIKDEHDQGGVVALKAMLKAAGLEPDDAVAKWSECEAVVLNHSNKKGE